LETVTAQYAFMISNLKLQPGLKTLILNQSKVFHSVKNSLKSPTLETPKNQSHLRAVTLSLLTVVQ
jgi:hypothetical protein